MIPASTATTTMAEAETTRAIPWRPVGISSTLSARPGRSPRGASLSLVVAHAAVLTRDLRIEGVFLERLVRAGARPEIGHLLDLSLGCGAHDLLPERKALLAHDVLQVFALQVGMR